MNKKTLITIAVVIIIALVGGGLYLAHVKRQQAIAADFIFVFIIFVISFITVKFLPSAINCLVICTILLIFVLLALFGGLINWLTSIIACLIILAIPLFSLGRG